jgi:hypothetical protein
MPMSKKRADIIEAGVLLHRKVDKALRDLKEATFFPEAHFSDRLAAGEYKLLDSVAKYADKFAVAQEDASAYDRKKNITKREYDAWFLLP